MKILLINAHPDYQNPDRSSNQLLAFTRAHLPVAQVETLNLYAPDADIPEITADTLNAPDTARQDQLIAQFKAADAVFIFMPLHNFNVVSRLKDYIDNILIANKTFKYTADGSVGLLTNKPIAYVQTSGSDYEHDIRYVNADIAPHYLRTIFNFMGISKMTVIRAQGLDLIENDKAALVEDAKQQLAAYIHTL